jgi:hypothetical protein
VAGRAWPLLSDSRRPPRPPYEAQTRPTEANRWLASGAMGWLIAGGPAPLEGRRQLTGKALDPLPNLLLPPMLSLQKVLAGGAAGPDK